MATAHTAEEVEQRYLEVMGSELGPIYQLLWNECVLLHWKWSDHVTLFGSSEERIELLNSAAPAFFRLIQDSIWEDVLLHISRFLDPPATMRKSNLTLLLLPQLVDSSVRPEVERRLVVAQQSCAFARDWRMRRIAHHDLSLALNRPVTPLAPANRISVKAALTSIANVLNALESHYCDGGTVAYEYFEPELGAKALLNVLRDGIEAREASHKRRLSGEF